MINSPVAAINTLPPLRDVLAENGLQPKKSLGQNFLLDLNITAKVARVAHPLAGANVIEVGPGPGGLTRALLASDAQTVTAIERDDRCIAALAPLQTLCGERFTLVAEDALTQDLAELTPAPRVVVANLPYNIATALLTTWVSALAKDQDYFSHMALMFQKEVADRIVAEPGTKSYGRLSVFIQWLCDTEFCFELPPSVFTPPPKVTSAVVRFTALPQPRHPANMDFLTRVTAVAFNQRRKMLRQSLKGLSTIVAADELLAETNIDPTLRAERLSVEEFCKLARALEAAES